MSSKKQSRLRRARKVRGKIARQGVARLSVFRSSQHFYAQMFSSDGSKVLVTASTVEAEIKSGLTKLSNCNASAKVGEVLAQRAQAIGIKSVAFDRSGFRYHGRVQSFAESARKNGLDF